MNEKVTFIVPPTTGERKLLEDSFTLLDRRRQGLPVHEQADAEVFRQLQEVRGETLRD